MIFKVLTIFPEFFQKALDFSMLKRAKENGNVVFEIYDIRKWAKPGVHKQIDDRPYGGGAGMVMMVDPIYRALKEIKDPNIPAEKTKSVIFSPKGNKYDQKSAENFADNLQELIIIAPHYEGFDERILDFVDMEISIGDYVLTGGELPALIVIDSVSRLLPGVLGNETSAKTESFSELKNGIRNTEHPQYTRPEVFVDDDGKEYKVPEVLLSGHHENIEKWRKENASM